MRNNYRKLFEKSRELRKNQTEAEKKLWSILRNRQILNLKFLRQKILDNFIVDFYCYEKRLVIEVDGKVHNTQKERDRERDNKLKEIFDLKIIRYKNEFILNNTEDFLKKELEKMIESLE